MQHRLPSQPLQNPNKNANAMTLGYGKELKELGKYREAE